MSKSFIKRNRQNIPNVEMQVCKKPEIFILKITINFNNTQIKLKIQLTWICASFFRL